MKHSLRLVNRNYFKRLLLGLLIFILLLHLPFSFAVLKVSKKSVLNNINTSNQTVLEQMHQNYISSSESISSLAASIFWRDDIQNLLYSPAATYEDVYFTLKDLYGTFIASHPNLQSICLYSKYTKELYVITSAGNIDRQEFLDFVKAQDSLRPLHPVLHSITTNAGLLQIEPMVFSHFMFQFHDPSQTNESFLVLNQFADQTISSIDTFSGTSESVPTATYYVTENALISSKTLSPDIAENHNALISRFRERKDTLPQEGSCYEETVNGKKYLLTYFHTKAEHASLVIIQDYDIVFHDLHALVHSFYLITGIFTVIAVILAFVVSRHLYRPIDNVYDFFTQSNTSFGGNAPRNINELDVIKHAYQSTSERNLVLENQGTRYRPIALQYGISSLLLKNNVHGLEQFHRAHPSHWLTTFHDGNLNIVLLKPVLSKDGGPLSEGVDLSLLLYGLQNVVEELLDPSYRFACFKHTRDTLGIVVSPKRRDGEKELFTALEKTCAFMKEHFSLSVAVAISSEGSAISELPTLLQEAVTGLSYTFLFGPSLITYDKISSNESNNQAIYPHELDERLEAAIASKDTEECRKTLSEMKTVIRQFNIQNAVICITALLNKLYQLLGKYPSAGSPAAEFPLTTIYGYISDTGTISQCIDTIFNYISIHLSGQSYESKSSNDLFVNTVFEFIQNSYSDFNLSSQLIADNLGLSNRYLMKKFKTLTGISLNEYITDLRLKMAAAFLRETDAPISTVSEQVGIDNLSYFYRLFKKAYGCTPKEFRENSGKVPPA